MSTNSGDATADRQRQRAARVLKKPGTAGNIDPPRQRRPAMAALAVLLIVGGALLAGWLAIRMDTRVPVLVASQDIAPGHKITVEDLDKVQVASEGLNLISEDQAEEIIGTYAKNTIGAETLIDENMLTRKNPTGDDRAVVSVGLNPSITPAESLRTGDLVQVVRVTGGAGGSTGGSEAIALGLVTGVNTAKSDDLGGSADATATLLVLQSAAAEVIDASSADVAGLALLSSGNAVDVDLGLD